MSFYGVWECHVTQHIGERKQKYNRKCENLRSENNRDYEMTHNFQIRHDYVSKHCG